MPSSDYSRHEWKAGETYIVSTPEHAGADSHDMTVGDESIASFDELLRATECHDSAELGQSINALMDGIGFVEIEWREDGVDVTVGYGSQALMAEFKFPIQLSEFWSVLNEYVDEVESLDDED